MDCSQRKALLFRGVLVAVFAGVVALGAGCENEPEAEAAPGPPPVTVEVMQVEPELLMDVASFSGHLAAENSVVVKPETDGVIEAVLFEEGQQVEQGTVLYRLRNEEQVARLREAEANLALAREEWGRTQGLVKRDAVSLAQKDRVAAELAVAKARVDLVRVALDRTEIRAPFAGVVGIRLVSPGERVTDETALVQIDAVDRLQVTFAMTDVALAFARTDVPVGLRVLPYPGESFPGEVFYVSPTIDPGNRRLVVKAWVPNPDGRLLPGLFANVDLEVGRREDALVIPESAVVYDRDGSYVWRVDDETPERVPIELGLRKQGRVEVTLGLQPGDTIVTAGTHKVSEGKRLRAAAPRSTGQARRARPDAEPGGEGT
jgi:membrane fusion protein (multidrug efflux system)